MVAYYSQKFSPPERHYCVTLLVKNLDHFHP